MPKVSGGDFRDNSLLERCDEKFLFFPQERQVMRSGKRFYGDPERLFAIADPAHELGREKCQAEQPGHFRLVDTFTVGDFGQ